jgi:peptidoglycan/xylan/chitin deacetylase (PgdA/CDA1 family)
MYHYVRPILGSKFPKIKGLETSSFKNQLDYLSKYFTIITVEELTYSIKKETSLPPNACWLTFDDGYSDHYDFVFPELVKRGIQGSFFPPANAIKNQKLLNVNAIHHILATCSDMNILINLIEDKCRKEGITETSLKTFWNKFAVSNRFDDKSTIYVKRMLQHVLPNSIRQSIIEELFYEFVGVNTLEFARSLYLSEKKITTMNNAGMFFGSHGTSHDWLNRMEKEAQKEDIKNSLDFLIDLGCSVQDWVMCYPYGAYNNETVQILEDLGCFVALTTSPGKADFNKNNRFTLPRFDTNDFPQ